MLVLRALLGSAEFYPVSRPRHKFKGAGTERQGRRNRRSRPPGNRLRFIPSNDLTGPVERLSLNKGAEGAVENAMIRALLTCTILAACAACSSSPAARTDAKAASATPPNVPADCRPDRASRIPPSPGECVPAPGRSYSDDEVRGTGQTSAADALRQLDPSIIVHH